MMNRKQQSAKEPRKPVKAQQQIPQKRIESAQEPGKRRVQQQQPLSDSMVLKERLNSIVKDYLLKGNCHRSLEVFEQESIRSGQENQMNVAMKTLLQNFDQGLRETFQSNWERFTPQQFRENDHDTWKLEFYLQIYFLIYPIHPFTSKRTRQSQMIEKDAVHSFKIFLENRGSDLSKTNEALPFYALPYVKSPQTHPSFSHLFTQEWVTSLRDRLVSFLQEIHGGDQRESTLQKIYLQSQKGGGANEQELQEYCDRLEMINNQLNNEVTELKNRVSSQQKAFQELNDNAQTNLIESQQKWFQFTRELAVLSKDLVKMIDHNVLNDIPFSEQKLEKIRKRLTQYEKFLNSNIDDLMSQSQDISLFEKASVMDQEQSNIIPYNPNLINQQSQNQTTIQQQHAEEENQNNTYGESNLVALDYGKIIHLFTTSTNYVFICNVLQALRWRISRSSSPYERRSVIVAYATHDVVGTHQRNIQLAQYLVLKSHPKVQEFTLKIINALASDYSGRTYLTQSSSLVKFLIETVKRENQDTIKRKNAIGALQKLSLRQQAQLWMIEHNLIHIILVILKNEKDSLSEYCYEYITAMLMNLSLRSAGKDKIENEKELAFEVLFSLIECVNEQVKIKNIRTFINGTLYSLLSRRSFRDYANHLNLGDILQNLYEESDDRFQKQIMYMIHQLKLDKNDSEEVEDTLSEQVEVEENDVDDIDDEDQCMFEDEDDEEQIQELNESMIVGEELLTKEFSLQGPEAEKVNNNLIQINYKQKLITDSIVLKELQQRSGYQQKQHQEQQEIQQLPIQQKQDINYSLKQEHGGVFDKPKRIQQIQQQNVINQQQQQQQQSVKKQYQQQQQYPQVNNLPPLQTMDTHQPQVQQSYAFQSRPKIPRTPPVFQDQK